MPLYAQCHHFRRVGGPDQLIYLVLRHIGHELLQLRVVQLLEAQQSIVVLLVVGTVPLAPDARLQEPKHEDVVVGLRLLQLRPRVIVHLIDGDIIRRPAVLSHRLLGDSGQLLQRDGGVVDVDGAILRLVRVLEDCSCSFCDAGERGGAEDALPAIVKINLLVLDITDEADLQAPVEEGPVDDERVRQTAGICLLLQRLLHLDLVRIDG